MTVPIPARPTRTLASTEHPLAILAPDTRFRFSLGRLLPKVERYTVYPGARGGIEIVPIVPDATPNGSAS